MSTYISHRSTTKDAQVIINVLDEGTEKQRITIIYEERDEGSPEPRRTLFRLSKEETAEVAHALKRPASETCRSCAHRKKFDVPENCQMYGKYYCEAKKNVYGGYDELRYPDTPSCNLYQKEAIVQGMTVNAELRTAGANLSSGSARSSRTRGR